MILLNLKLNLKAVIRRRKKKIMYKFKALSKIFSSYSAMPSYFLIVQFELSLTAVALTISTHHD